MPESDAIPPEETSVKSLLEKPLEKLTEDDIAQLTREDCRRYLKEKGMRRPSWNKSQAIQQVIMLKKLIEPAPDFDSGSRKRLRISGSNYSRNNDSTLPESVSQGTCGEAESSVPAPYLREDLNKPDTSGGFFRRVTAINESAPPSIPGSSNMSEGQMTIFYGGKVNVYEDVPPDKARAILHVAASPVEISQEQPVGASMLLQPRSRFSKAVTIKDHSSSSVTLLLPRQIAEVSDSSRVLGEGSNMLREEAPVEGSSTRKASVRRYLEKRRDRFKSKRRTGLTSCGSAYMYINHQISDQMPMRSSTCSPTLIRLPSIPPNCSLVENESVKNICSHSSRNNNGL